jgi:hypothetical protein
MIPVGIVTCWNKVLQYKNILNNNSALVGMDLYSNYLLLQGVAARWCRTLSELLTETNGVEWKDGRFCSEKCHNETSCKLEQGSKCIFSETSTQRHVLRIL